MLVFTEHLRPYNSFTINFLQHIVHEYRLYRIYHDKKKMKMIHNFLLSSWSFIIFSFIAFFFVYIRHNTKHMYLHYYIVNLSNSILRRRHNNVWIYFYFTLNSILSSFIHMPSYLPGKDEKRTRYGNEWVCDDNDYYNEVKISRYCIKNTKKIDEVQV